MILRKPYAFLIKHFKLIHFILALLLGYLIYKTGTILSFLNEYIGSTPTTGGEYVSKYYNVLMFIIPFLVIIVAGVIMATMINKKKPFVFYIITIASAILILVFYYVTRGIVSELEVRLIDVRTLRLVRDVVTIVFIVQILSVVIILFRAIGFDVKKFNFKKDLEELEVDESDREEFEFVINVDSDKTKRNMRKRFRNMKYVYFEHQFLINSLLLLAGLVGGYFLFMNIFIYNKDSNQNNFFTTGDFVISITDSFDTEKGFDGTVLDEMNSYTILRIKIRSRGAFGKKLNNARVAIVVNDHKFYPTLKHFEKFTDLGDAYSGTIISTSAEYEDYILIYEIPKPYKNKAKEFVYFDNASLFDANRITIPLKTVDLDKVEDAETYLLGEEVDLKESIFKNTILNLTAFDIKESFTLNYEFCSAVDNCYPSVEYLYPSIFNNYDKALIKVNGSVNWDPDLPINKTTSLYSFIRNYGKFSYIINDESKEQRLSLKQVKPTKVSYKNSAFIEVEKEMLEADRIFIDFNIRNMRYRYVLK